MKAILTFCLGFMMCFAAAGAAAEYENARQEVKKLLAEDFAALNKGKITLAEFGERTCALAGKSSVTVKRRILYEGAKRIFERAGELERAAKVKELLDMETRLFVAHGQSALLRLGKYGEIEFAHCPTGTVDLSVNWRNGKTERVTLTKPYWIMKYPLTRRQSALFPPLDPPNGIVSEEAFKNYVCLNRTQAEGLSEYFTRRFSDVLPDGYVIRLPTLAEWEYAFHAGTRDQASPFYDLLHIHMRDEVDRAVRYDYDAKKPQRKQAVNAWGIGDWCGQEKVYDTVDPSKIEVSPKDKGDFIQVRALPPLETTVDPCFTYKGLDAMTLIRMPFWARWNAARIGFDQDWCPIRLVIAPKIN